MCRPPLLTQKGSSPSLNEDFALCLFESKMGTSLKKKWVAKLKHQCEYMHHIACNASKLALNGYLQSQVYSLWENFFNWKETIFKKEFPDSFCAYRGNFKQKQTKKPKSTFFPASPISLLSVYQHMCLRSLKSDFWLLHSITLWDNLSFNV